MVNDEQIFSEMQAIVQRPTRSVSFTIRMPSDLLIRPEKLIAQPRKTQGIGLELRASTPPCFELLTTEKAPLMSTERSQVGNFQETA
jgi:hypothetical protein